MIVDSKIVQSTKQVDGRTIIREQHTDDQGTLYFCDYMASKGIDTAQHLAANADQLNAQFKYAVDNAVPIAQAMVDDANLQLTVAQQALTKAQAKPVMKGS